MSGRLLAPDWCWIDGAFSAGVRIEVDGEGRIVRCGTDLDPDPRLGAAEPLEDKALLPGFVNAHSHAFQRALRGRGERFPREAGDFWSWRQAMYALVEALDDETLYRWCRRAYAEMRAAGITAVGEFHYLHHDDAAALDHRFDEVVARAARDSGLRVVVLQTYYRTGGIDEPLDAGQRRFSTPDPGRYWASVDRLAATVAGSRVTVGAAAHSVRAAPPAEIAALHAEATRRGLPFHLHLEEQEGERSAALAAWGRTPTAAISAELTADGPLTAVHATWSDAEALAALVNRGGGVCLCPTTEANLGDGLPRSAAPGVAYSPSLGTDSNARISMLEEMRWLEYGQRLATGRRGVVVDDDGANAPRLLDCATRCGAAALGLEAGTIAAGRWADFAVVDLTHPSLAGWQPETLLDSLVFGGADGAIAGAIVGGAAD